MSTRTPWLAAATAAAGEVRENQVWVSRPPFFFLVRQHRGAGGTGLVVIGGVFVGMDNEFVFTIDTPVDRKLFL